MSNREYREGRVKVSLDIKNAILALMRHEKDTGQKKIHPAKWYRDAVAKALSLGASGNPSLRSYEVVITELRGKFKVTNPLDEEWHVGTLLDYPISPAAVAKIIDYKLKARANNTDRITIRTALWMARLSALPLSVYNLHFIASGYALQEEMRDLIGDEYEFSARTDDDFVLKLLSEYPDDMLKEKFKTAEQISGAVEGLRKMVESITPEEKEIASNKIKRHKAELKAKSKKGR